MKFGGLEKMDAFHGAISRFAWSWYFRGSQAWERKRVLESLSDILRLSLSISDLPFPFIPDSWIIFRPFHWASVMNRSDIEARLGMRFKLRLTRLKTVECRKRSRHWNIYRHFPSWNLSSLRLLSESTTFGFTSANSPGLGLLFPPVARCLIP